LKFKSVLWIALLFLMRSAYGSAQQWAQILDSSRAVDWSGPGAGAIPERPTLCASLTDSATLAQINAALSSCPAEQTVYLAPGTYSVPGTINIPSNVTLRGAGADRTILKATGTRGGYVVRMGWDSVPYQPIKILGGSTAGSTAILLSNASGISMGQYLVIAESNDPKFVSSTGIDGLCKWCDNWTNNGGFARGQIVAVTGIKGDRVTISPGLYSAYTLTPIAVPFSMNASHAGVEDLQVFANNTGYDASFGMWRCAYCWIKGVESNYADGDLVEVFWGFHDEVRDSYFSNAFLHKPGLHDSSIHIGYKTSASLFENNIVERARVSFQLDWGAAGNVLAYNYTTGEFIGEAPEAVIGGFRFHGAHPQFNLLEGNVATTIDADPVWGTSSHITAFRNWILGTNLVCSPHSGRSAVNCSGQNGRYGFQAARAVNVSYLSSSNNFVGNVIGSAKMQALMSYNRPSAQVPVVEYPSTRSYDAAAYGWSFGFGSFSDSGAGTGCGSGAPPCHLAGTSSSDFLHGNFNNVDGSIGWANGVTHALPASLYLAGKPGWWGALPFPATGPEIAGGTGPRGHSFGNPAQACYLNAMGGANGGAGSPLVFNAASCYGK
jgi:hypothetical protein